jgi:hypothetical protein
MSEFFRIFCNQVISVKDAYLELDFGIKKDFQSEYFDNIQALRIEEKILRLRSQLSSDLSKSVFENIGFIVNTIDNYENLVKEINSIIEIIKTNLKKDDYGILMAYSEVVKASAYIWFPESMGGQELGKCYYTKLYPGENQYPSFARTKAQSDGIGAGFGMVGWALSVGIWGGPVTLLPLLGTFVFSAVYSAVTSSV